MKAIGVGINLNKSILSPSGKGLEFAKRTFIDNRDVSPISLRDLSICLQPGNISQWVAFSKTHGLSFSEQAKILGFGHIAIRGGQSFRKLNHALKVLYLANIAKIDFNTDVLSLRSKSPIDFDKNVESFKTQVLKPILDALDRGFHGYPTGDPNVAYSISPSFRWKSEVKYAEPFLRDWFKTPMGQHLLRQETDILFSKTTGIILDQNLTPLIDNPKLRTQYENFALQIQSDTLLLHKELVNVDSYKIFEDLYKALNSIKLDELITFDDCLSAYLKIQRLKCVQDLNVLRLNKRDAFRPSVKLPYQARLFRQWSRLVSKIVRDN